jgi:hypothetical protein
MADELTNVVPQDPAPVAAPAVPSPETLGGPSLDSLVATALPDGARLSAKDALGLDDSPRELLKQPHEKMVKQMPAEQMPRDAQGRFLPAAAAPVKPKRSGRPVTPTPAPAAPAPAATPTPALVKPADPAPAPAPAAPPKPAKVKVGDKEYTEAELAELVSKAQARPAPVPAPAAPPKPADPAPKPPTPEEVRAAEDKWIAAQTPALRAPTLTKDEVEAVLVGGDDGLKAFTSILQRTQAHAVLEARKSIYAELVPVLENLRTTVQPLAASNQQLEELATETAFVQAYPEYSGQHLETAREIARLMVEQYPDQVSRLTRQQFVAEVDRQASQILEREFKQWYPAYEGSWKDWQKAQAKGTPPPAATPATAPAAAPLPGTLVPAAAPVAPAAPRPKPPAGNSPGAVSGVGKDWQKGVAGSLLA